MRRPTRRTRRAAAVALAAALLLTGCIGTTPREDFEEEVRARGGGFDEDHVLDAVDDLGRRLGTGRDGLQVRTFSVSPSSGTVVVEARNPASPDDLDRYLYRSGELDSTEPVRLTAADDLDQQTFALGDFALDRLGEIVEEALGAYGVEGAYVDGIRLQRRFSGDDVIDVIVVSMESDRSSADATFTADGTLEGVERR